MGDPGGVWSAPGSGQHRGDGADMAQDTKPCAHCKTAPRGSAHPSYCADCHRLLAAKSRARRLERVRAGLDTRPCARCKTAPRAGTQSYCSSCLRVLGAASKGRVRSKPCGRCEAAPRNGSGKYCADCDCLVQAMSAARQRGKVDLRKCSRCKTAPRNSSLKSYCVDCKRALQRESMQRTGGKRKLVNCSRCGGPRAGRHPNYCVACFKSYREEQREQPCSRCGTPRAEGDRRSTNYCNNCSRDYWLRVKYGLTGEQYDQMLIDQAHRCALCGNEKNGQQWHVDHCHDTGKVRGVLCHHCNVGLGHFRDDAALLRRAAEYLEAHASV